MGLQLEVHAYAAAIGVIRGLPDKGHFDTSIDRGRNRHLANLCALHRYSSGGTRPHPVVEARSEDYREVDQPAEHARILHLDVHKGEAHGDVGVVGLRPPQEPDSGIVPRLREEQAANGEGEFEEVPVIDVTRTYIDADLQHTRTGQIRVDSPVSIVE